MVLLPELLAYDRLPVCGRAVAQRRLCSMGLSDRRHDLSLGSRLDTIGSRWPRALGTSKGDRALGFSEMLGIRSGRSFAHDVVRVDAVPDPTSIVRDLHPSQRKEMHMRSTHD